MRMRVEIFLKISLKMIKFCMKLLVFKGSERDILLEVEGVSGGFDFFQLCLDVDILQIYVLVMLKFRVVFR